MSMDISDFYQTFFDEADELLADMEQHLLSLAPEAPDSEQLNAIFRAAHSIKGGAGTFGFSVLQETTHLMENLLDEARRGEMTEIVRSVTQVNDIMGEIASASDEQRRGIEQVAQAVSQMDQVTQQNAALVEQAAAATDSLSGQAGRLTTLVSAFTIENIVHQDKDIALTPQRVPVLT